MRRTPSPSRESELLLLHFDSFFRGADNAIRFTQSDSRTEKTKTKAKTNKLIQPWSVPVYSEPSPVMSPSLVPLTPRGCQNHVLYQWLLRGEEKQTNFKSKQNRSGSKFMYQVEGHPSRCPTHPSATRTILSALYSSSLVRSSIVLRAPFARISIWGSFFVLNGTPCFGSWVFCRVPFPLV